MLTFEEKLTIIQSFPELERKDVSLGRINFQYAESATDKKNVVYHLHPNGNGFVYAEYVNGYHPDNKGLVNIRDFSAEELKDIIEQSIKSLSPKTTIDATVSENAEEEERWVNDSNHALLLVLEDEMWNVYAGVNLDGTFRTYSEARSYLIEEGFSLQLVR